ncbi:hypothetical protein AAHZ94_04160 [Streptomyces sp. HSW2009]|uniref:hypothetical protein n=1 Tax=Streptomyces sp. HSW2009 TaxID=3142890 RepID=UPI0032EB8D62
MRTIRVDDGKRIVLLALDDGSDVFVFVHAVPHGKAHSWAKRRLHSVNAATRRLEVRDLTGGERPVPEGHGTEAAEADAVVRTVSGWVAAGVAPSESQSVPGSTRRPRGSATGSPRSGSPMTRQECECRACTA